MFMLFHLSLLACFACLRLNRNCFVNISHKSSDRRSDSIKIAIRESLRVEPNSSVNMFDKSLGSDSNENTFKELSLNYCKKSSRRHRMSNARRDSPYARKSAHRERSRTEDSLVTNLRSINSPSVYSRLSMPGGSGLSSPVYSDADAWITDSIADKSATPKISKGKWQAKGSKGPFLGSYQLLGDSLFVRFADQILKSRAVIGENGKFCNGHCVSGQTITDLGRRISKDFISNDVIVLIGTNDFLRNSHAMEIDMKSLLEFLSYCAENVVILTLPPIPRLKNTVGYWKQWESYNDWLKTLDNGKTIKVIDIAPLFMLKPRTPDMATFESHMGYGDKKRVDHIHLNKLGLLRLHREIKKQLHID